MCLICERIKMIQEGTNPYFVKELSTGYVVMGDHQHFTGYTLFLCKEHKTELFQSLLLFRQGVWRIYVCTGDGRCHLFRAASGRVEKRECRIYS